MRMQNVKNIQTHIISAVQFDMEVPDHEADMQQGTYRLIQPLNQPGWTSWYSVC